MASIKTKLLSNIKNQIKKGIGFITFLFLKKQIKGINTFLFFLGFPRSGHSIIGALLDAHPNCIISHELNAFSLMSKGFSFYNICSLIILKSKMYSMFNFKRGGYKYQIKDQYQGKVTKLKIIGDKKGGGTTDLFDKQIIDIDKISKFIPFDYKSLIVIRNPFDNIATIAIKSFNSNINDALDFYRKKAKTIERLITVLENKHLIVYHEKFIEEPQKELEKILDFVNLSKDSSYLQSSVEILYDKPNLSREKLKWNQTQINAIKNMMHEISFLQFYSNHH